MGSRPIVVVAVVLIMYFIYSERDKRMQIKALQETIDRKDQIIIQSNIREQQLNDKLLEYAFKLHRKEDQVKEADSLLREKTEAKVKKRLND